MTSASGLQEGPVEQLTWELERANKEVSLSIARQRAIQDRLQWAATNRLPLGAKRDLEPASGAHDSSEADSSGGGGGGRGGAWGGSGGHVPSSTRDARESRREGAGWGRHHIGFEGGDGDPEVAAAAADGQALIGGGNGGGGGGGSGGGSGGGGGWTGSIAAHATAGSTTMGVARPPSFGGVLEGAGVPRDSVRLAWRDPSLPHRDAPKLPAGGHSKLSAGAARLLSTALTTPRDSVAASGGGTAVAAVGAADGAARRATAGGKGRVMFGLPEEGLEQVPLEPSAPMSSAAAAQRPVNLSRPPRPDSAQRHRAPRPPPPDVEGGSGPAAGRGAKAG